MPYLVCSHMQNLVMCGRDGLHHLHVVQPIKYCIEVVYRIWKGGITVISLLLGFIVQGDLDTLPQALGVPAVSKVAIDSL